ncbi:MAG: hypothetical protein KatS3mg082_0466 [Nitrospiraceae bacterium]|nr:MAG: hypothetical protein KatS3mg082_0466 [Nitrospiraceae bacterium]
MINTEHTTHHQSSRVHSMTGWRFRKRNRGTIKASGKPKNKTGWTRMKFDNAQGTASPMKSVPSQLTDGIA